MREEYDLRKLTVKRRGLLPELKDEKGKQAKVRITISLDRDIVDYFKQSAGGVGSLPYQTQINQMLRRAIENNQQGDIETVKLELLKDADFIRALASQISTARRALRSTASRPADKSAGQPICTAAAARRVASRDGCNEHVNIKLKEY